MKPKRISPELYPAKKKIKGRDNLHKGDTFTKGGSKFEIVRVYQKYYLCKEIIRGKLKPYYECILKVDYKYNLQP